MSKITILSESYYWCKKCKRRLGLFSLMFCKLRKHHVIIRQIEKEIEI